MAPTEKSNTLATDGAKRGDVLVGFEGWTQGIELEALEDIRPTVDRISAKVRLISAGSIPYSFRLAPYIGRSMTGTELHDLIRKQMGKPFLKFLSPPGYRVESGLDSTTDPRPSTVQGNNPRDESGIHEKERHADEISTDASLRGPIHTTQLLEEAQDELTSNDYWNRQVEEPNLVYREIEQRRGQAAFRKNLLNAYGGKCAVTGCDLEEALEAAHVDRYSESYSNDVRNGLLLRADIHTLFDCYLITVHPENYRIQCADKLLECKDYRPLVGRELRLPDKRHDWPAKEFLTQHYKTFLDQNK